MGVGRELRPALERLPAWGGRAVLGLRDILDDPATVRREWRHDGVIEFTEAHCDGLLIYGNPGVFDFVAEYELPASLAVRALYTGYVVHRDATHRLRLAAPSGRRPRVLATAGGGEDGRRLLETFAGAARVAQWDAVMVAGPQSSPANQRALRSAAEEAGVEFHASVLDLSGWLLEVDALVSMGGYNTLSEALSAPHPVRATRPPAQRAADPRPRLREPRPAAGDRARPVDPAARAHRGHGPAGTGPARDRPSRT
jgi:predicted glycosyltransferase